MEKREKEKGKKERKGNRKKENKRRKIEKRFRKLGEISRKIRREVKKVFLRIFLGFSDNGVNFGTAVMARRTRRRDCSGAGFPTWWPTAALGRHAMGDGPSAGGASGIRGMRAEGERENNRGFERR
jgi:hypothetical protein